MIAKLKNMLLYSSSTSHFGRELFNIVEQQGFEELFDQTKGKYKYTEECLPICIFSLYFFSYYVATQRNAYNIDNNTLGSIFYYFQVNLLEAFRQKYTNNLSNKELLQLLENKSKEYLELYNQHNNNLARDVISVVIKDLINVEIDVKGEQYQELMTFVWELVVNTITIIQDYFIDLSTKRYIHI